MAEERVQRRLAAILAADVVGYSRLVRADEEGTLAALRELREAIIDPKITEHHGRIVKLMGDGMLAEFGSVVDAVRNAIEVQQGVAEHQADVTEDRRILFRVGVNLGDVVIDGDDIQGDGVNVAARLEALADPGGICISGKVYEEVRDRVDTPFEDLGEQTIKNINRPVRVWRWARGDLAAREMAAMPNTAGPSDKPSIAVLPFDSMSDDREQEYFADGIVEDIITELSRFSWLSVIARNTTFTFKDAAADIKEIGSQLGVRYVMEGSVRKAGDRVRINAQLIEAQSGAHVWAERYDRELTDVFAVQDEITENVSGAIQPEIISAEVDRIRRDRPESMAAWDYSVRGRWHVQRLTKEDNAEAQRLLREGLARYPDDVSLLAFLSFSLVSGVIFGWSDDPFSWITEARGLAQRAANLNENDAWVHCVLGVTEFIAKQPDNAVAHYTKAIELSPSFALGHGYLALQLAFAGDVDAAIRAAETAIRLSPRDPELFHFYVAIGTAHFVAERYDEAAKWADKAVRERPGVGPGPLRLLATSLSQLGQMEEARHTYAELLDLSPHVSASGIRNAMHFGNPDAFDRYIDGLRELGLPE